MSTKVAERQVRYLEETSAPGTDVVFLAPIAAASTGDEMMRRTLVFAHGEAIPRIGECVILAFGGVSSRWQVLDVAHVFEDEVHGIAIKLMPPSA